MQNFEAPDYLRLLKGGTRYRLMRLKDRVIQSQAKPPSRQLASWREARAYGFHNWAGAYAAMSQGFNGTNESNRVPAWVTHCGEYFRDERFSHEIVRSHPRGWYTNHDGTTYKDGSGLCTGIVARLPHGRFVAGYHWGDNGERVWFATIYSDEADAAHAANGHAESWAEIRRDDSENYENARKLEREIEDAFARLRECLALRHKACMAYVRDEAHQLCEKIRTARETLKTEYADYV